MIPVLQAEIEKALEEARAATQSREMSLVITKLEEALHWFHASQKKYPDPSGPR